MNKKKETISVDEQDPVIEVKDLRISFSGNEVLKSTTFKLNKGENLVILGKSGTGKSVLIKCIVGLLTPDSGSIKVFGQEIRSLNKKQLGEFRQKIGFLFQSGALYDSMTIKQNLEFPLVRIRKDISRKEVENKIQSALENVGLKEALHKMPSELSGGMRKRASLARTIIVDPLIMLYDEPTTGLDPVTSDEISLLINQIKEKYKTSSIIITHDIRCATKTADRIIMLNNGVIHKEGSIEDFEKSDDEMISAFFNEKTK